jgi:hypothetical protein
LPRASPACSTTSPLRCASLPRQASLLAGSSTSPPRQRVSYLACDLPRHWTCPAPRQPRCAPRQASLLACSSITPPRQRICYFRQRGLEFEHCLAQCEGEPRSSSTPRLGPRQQRHYLAALLAGHLLRQVASRFAKNQNSGSPSATSPSGSCKNPGTSPPSPRASARHLKKPLEPTAMREPGVGENFMRANLAPR